MGLIDTNILVYLIDTADKIRHEQAKKFFAQVMNNPLMFAVSLQNLREFCSVSIKKKNAAQGQIEEHAVLFKTFFQKIIQDTEEDALNAIKHSFEKNTPFWDSLIAATMQRNEIEIIYTENTKDFKNFEAIKAINPLE